MDAPNTATALDIAIAALSGLFWTLAYVLIVRRGFKEKTFGVPAACLCLNTSWEFLFAFVFPVPSPAREGNMVWCALDVLMLYQCFRFGREDYTNALVQRWFYVWLAIGCGLGFLVEFSFVREFQDTVGRISGTLSGLVMCVLMNALLLRRGSVRGQSVFIALFMFLGNVFGYLMALNPKAPGPAVSNFFLHSMFAVILPLNCFYIWLVWQQCRSEGITPWKRW